MNGRERGKLLRDEIFAAYEAKQDARRPNRLRPSELGHECARYLWYRFRWADEHETFEGRMLRLFDTGHSQEDRMIADLRSVGAEVYARDPDNPKEQIAMEMLNGHSKGFLDGVGGNIPHANSEWCVVECKSHSEKSFKALEKDGVEIAKPQHYGQMQLYMKHHKLDEALYISVCKNTDDIYCEFVPYNQRYAEALENKAKTIVALKSIPPRINNNPTFFKCKFCSAHAVCHQGALPPRSCRTCQYVTPDLVGEVKQGWTCTLQDKSLDLDDQRRGCEYHRYNPHMVKGTNTEERVVGSNVTYVYVDENGQIYEDAGPAGDKKLESV